MTTSTPQRYQLDDLDEHELALIMEFRTRRAAPEPTPPPAPRRRRTGRADWLLYCGTALLLVLMIVAALPRALESAGVSLPLDATPLPTQAAPAAPRSAPPVVAGGTFAPPAVTAAPVVYPLTVPGVMRGAWAPDQPATIDVSGRAYRLLSAAAGWQEVELDDGTRLWLTDPRLPGVVPGVPTVAPAAAEAAPPAAPVVEPTWGPGGTSGGTTWGEPTAAPLRNAILPAAPALSAPTPTWGEGGSSGGVTW